MTNTRGGGIEARQEPTAPRRRRSPAAVVVALVWTLVLLIAAAGGTYRYATAYRRFANKALGPNVRHVDVQPSPGAAPVRVTRPDDIAQLRAALVSAARTPPDGANVYDADCAMRIVYGDGRDEQLLIGRVELASQEPSVPNEVVAIQWGGYRRYVGRDTLRRLLVPHLVGPTPSTGPVTQPSP